MTHENYFNRSFAVVVGLEGGYSNDPDDPGGETIYGITRRDHAAAWANGRPTIEAAKKIYFDNYWTPCKADQMPWPLCLYVFDSAVNQGVTPAIKMLQRTLQTVQDGIIGRQTVALAKKSNEWHLARFMAFRAIRYQTTRNYDKYGEGWLTRLFEVSHKGGIKND